MARRALLFEDSLAALPVPLQLQGFLIGGDHVLAAGLRRGENPDSPCSHRGGRVLLEQLEPGGVHVGTTDGALLDRVEKRFGPGRPGEESLGRRRAELGAHLGPCAKQDPGGSDVVEAGQSLDGGRLYSRRLTRAEQLGQQRPHLLERRKSQRQRGGGPLAGGPRFVDRGRAGAGQKAGEDRPIVAAARRRELGLRCG